MHEVKFVNLAEFKVSSDAPGEFSGYISKWGELDEGGDIVAKDAHADTLAQFLTRGFSTDSHDWSFGDGLIGYPVSAIEDEVGTLVSSRFHSDQKSQDVRTKVLERKAAGMGVYLSIGYEPSVPPVFIYPKDYATEIPKYSKPELVEANLAKAARFPKVRILVKNHLYEGALVTSPMLRSASVLSAKSADGKAAHPIDIKGMFEAELSDRTNSPYALFDIFCSVIWRLSAMESVSADMGVVVDIPALLDEALNEFMQRLRDSVLGDLGYGSDAAGMAGMGVGKDDAGAVKGSLVDGLAFATHLGAVVDAANGIVLRAKAKAAMQAKEGRRISAVTRDKIRAMHARLTEILPVLEELMADEKEDDQVEKGKDSPPMSKEELRRLVTRSLVWDAQQRQGEYLNAY